MPRRSASSMREFPWKGEEIEPACGCVQRSSEIPSVGGVARSAGVGLLPRPKPPEVPPCSRGDDIFIETGAATRLKNSLTNGDSANGAGIVRQSRKSWDGEAAV